MCLNGTPSNAGEVSHQRPWPSEEPITAAKGRCKWMPIMRGSAFTTPHTQSTHMHTHTHTLTLNAYMCTHKYIYTLTLNTLTVDTEVSCYGLGKAWPSQV